jgi:hypothetical protein
VAAREHPQRALRKPGDDERLRQASACFGVRGAKVERILERPDRLVRPVLLQQVAAERALRLRIGRMLPGRVAQPALLRLDHLRLDWCFHSALAQIDPNPSARQRQRGQQRSPDREPSAGGRR